MSARTWSPGSEHLRSARSISPCISSESVLSSASTVRMSSLMSRSIRAVSSELMRPAGPDVEAAMRSMLVEAPSARSQIFSSTASSIAPPMTDPVGPSCVLRFFCGAFCSQPHKH